MSKFPLFASIAVFATLTASVCVTPALAQTPKISIFGVNISGVLLNGGWNPHNGWISDSGVQTSVFPGAAFDVYSGEGKRLSRIIVERPTPPDGVAGWIAETRSESASVNDICVALSGVTQPFPRPTRAQKLNNPVYQKAIAAYLTGRGAKVKSAKLNQLWRVDLNGDGIEEVLFTAREQSPARSSQGRERLDSRDYAVAGIRFVDKASGRVKIVALDIQVSSTFKTNDWNQKYTLLGCPDLNGDGKQEIMLSSNYGEGSLFSTWTFNGRTLKKVVESGYGN